MKLTPIALTCLDRGCPSVYATDEGEVVVQGYVVTESQAGMTLPPGESLVEIPRELLLSAARSILGTSGDIPEVVRTGQTA